jgi:Retron-type reverse transcriptase
MRLPQPLLDSPFFQFDRLADLERALGDVNDEAELSEVRRLAAVGLPPIATLGVLATMLGINRGLIWSLINRTPRYYRAFTIPKGRGYRRIYAPKIALKIPQKWIGVQLARHYIAPNHVFGFVPGRSHVDAARVHVGARWVFSMDIEDFFPSTPKRLVEQILVDLGYGLPGAEIIAALTCLNGSLAQGAPSSPVLSNLCFAPWDKALAVYAERSGVRLSRYADDVVFSGEGDYPEGLREEVEALLRTSPWKISEHKVSLSIAPKRLKVHGLLVHGERIRLTKGYRNRIRAYRHLLGSREDIGPDFLRRVTGHLSYAKSVDV